MLNIIDTENELKILIKRQNRSRIEQMDEFIVHVLQIKIERK